MFAKAELKGIIMFTIILYELSQVSPTNLTFFSVRKCLCSLLRYYVTVSSGAEQSIYKHIYETYRLVAETNWANTASSFRDASLPFGQDRSIVSPLTRVIQASDSCI